MAFKVDLILAAGGPAVHAAKRATQTLPIVAFASGDPVVQGLISSLAHPGGNVTGNSVFDDELIVKRLQLIAEAVGGKPARIAYLGTFYPGLQALPAVRSHGAQFHVVLLKSIDQLDEAFESMARLRVNALAIENSAVVFVNADRIAALAARYRLPAIGEFRQLAEAGLLMSYGVDYVDLAHKSAAYVDRILKGANPGDLPFERATRFEMVVNLKTAKALGLTIPQAILMRADETIQ
jgi:putative ABC transport system substrate-binding protein